MRRDTLRLEPGPGLPVYAPEFSGPAQMRRQNRITEMLKMARELAGHGHRPQMIEAMRPANGFPEAQEKNTGASDLATIVRHAIGP